MKANKGRDYSTLLIWAAAVVTVVRYSAAFIASDMGEITGKLSLVITWLMGFSGMGMGILDVIGATYLFDGWRRSMPASGKKWSFRFKALTGFVFALMATGVMILVPFTVSRVTHESMEMVLNTGLRLNWWAFLVNVAPYLLIGGVSIGNQIVSVSYSKFHETFSQNTESYMKVSGNFQSVDWRKIRRSLTEEQVRELAEMDAGRIQDIYSVPERTAFNWKRNARREIESRQP